MPPPTPWPSLAIPLSPNSHESQKSFNDFSKEQFELILGEKPEIEEKNFKLFKGRDNKVSGIVNGQFYNPYRDELQIALLIFENIEIGTDPEATFYQGGGER